MATELSNLEYERQLAAAILGGQHSPLMDKIFGSLTQHKQLFTNELCHHVSLVALGYWGAHGESIPVSFMLDELAKESSETRRTQLVTFAQQLFGTPGVSYAQADELYERLVGLERVRLIVESSKQILEAVERGNFEGAEEIYEGMSEPIFMRGTGPQVIDVLDSRGQRYNRIEQIRAGKVKQGALTGIPVLDEQTQGLFPSEVGVLLAMTGEGKSIGIMDFLFNAFQKQGYTAIFITIEMSALQAQLRFDSRASAINYTKIKFAEQLEPMEIVRLKAKHQELIEVQEKSGNYWFIIDIPEGASVSIIQNEVRRLMARYKLENVVVGVDYINLIQPPASSERDRSRWRQLGEITQQLKTMSRALNVPIWTAAQLNPKTGAISESYLIQWAADLVVRIEPQREGEQENMRTMTMPKYRDGRGIPMTLYRNLAIMRLYDPAMADQYGMAAARHDVNGDVGPSAASAAARAAQGVQPELRPKSVEEQEEFDEGWADK